MQTRRSRIPHDRRSDRSAGQRGHRRPARGCARRDDHARPGRPRAARGRAGHRQDEHGARVRRCARHHAQPHPVHARPHARRHHGHRRAGRQARSRSAARVPVGPALRQPDPGRRDQPGLSPHAERAARGDAGGDRHDRQRHPSPAAPVLGARDPESGGDAGHLPAARSPARPLPAEAALRLPEGRRAHRDRAPHDRHGRTACPRLRRRDAPADGRPRPVPSVGLVGARLCEPHRDRAPAARGRNGARARPTSGSGRARAARRH